MGKKPNSLYKLKMQQIARHSLTLLIIFNVKLFLATTSSLRGFFCSATKPQKILQMMSKSTKMSFKMAVPVHVFLQTGTLLLSPLQTELRRESRTRDIAFSVKALRRTSSREFRRTRSQSSTAKTMKIDLKKGFIHTGNSGRC